MKEEPLGVPGFAPRGLVSFKTFLQLRVCVGVCVGGG